jgi:hypothetical protein
MAPRVAPVAFATAPKGFRRTMGHEHLRKKAASEEPARDRSLVQQAAAG